MISRLVFVLVIEYSYVSLLNIGFRVEPDTCKFESLASSFSSLVTTTWYVLITFSVDVTVTAKIFWPTFILWDPKPVTVAFLSSSSPSRVTVDILYGTVTS